MSNLLFVDESGRPLRKMENVTFSQNAYQVVCQEGAAFFLLPLTMETRETDILLRYAQQGMTPVAERLAKMNDQTFARFVKKLVHTLVRIQMSTKLDLGSVLVDFGSVYCDAEDQPWFLYTCQQTAEDGHMQQMQVVAQLRQIREAGLRTEALQPLWEYIDDPFCDLFSLNNYFFTHAVDGMGTGSAPSLQIGGDQPQEEAAMAEQTPQPERTAPVQQAGDDIFAVRGGIPIGRTTGTLVGLEQSAPAKLVIGQDEPTNIGATMPFQSASSTTSVLYASMDEPTSCQLMAPSQPAARPSGTPYVSMDQPTGDNAAPQGFPAPPPRRSEPPAYEPPAPPPMRPQPKPIASEAPVARSAQKKAQPEGVSDATWNQYLQQRQAFRYGVICLVVALVLLVGLGLVLGAFLGPIGILLEVLVAVVVVAVLINRGTLDCLKPVRKPKPTVVEPDKPEINPVFSVRIKLRSTNLTSQVEITIRERDQLIGSDAKSCPVPLDFPGVSRRHCRICCKRVAGHTDYCIRDEGSRNGTELNGERLEPGQDYALHVGDRITLAHRYQFVVHSDAC